MFTTQIHQRPLVPPESQENYQKPPILSRTEAEKYRRVLKPDSRLYQDISRILIHFQSGIHSLSNGQKINVTHVKLLGGNQKIDNALIFKSSHKHKRKALHFQAPPGQHIVKWELRLEGKEEDQQKLDYELYHLAPGSKISKHDLETWERSGKAKLDANVAGLSPLNIGAQGSAQKRDEKVLEESYSHQTLVLAVTVKKGLFKSMGPVTVSVDVWVDDLPDTTEQVQLEVTSSISGATSAEGGVSSTAGGQITNKETLDRTKKIASQITDAKAKKDIKSEASIPKIATDKQMKASVDIDHLRAEVDRINKEIETCKKEKQEALKGYKDNKDDEFLSDDYQAQAKDLTNKIKAYEARKKALEDQIDTILKTTGQEKTAVGKKK